MKRKYGWLRQHLDQRDIPYLSISEMGLYAGDLPESVDLRPNCPPIYDQGDLGSCTANAIVAAYEFDLMKSVVLAANPYLSRLFLYYNERRLEGTTEYDSGANIRDGIKVVNNIGICEESLWPYDVQSFKLLPSPICYDNSQLHQSILYAAVNPTIQDVQSALADGFPVVFGFTVYQSFESDETAKTGIMKMPKRSERTLGGHAVLAVGYDEATQMLLVRNSWGIDWGLDGYFWMPFGYMHLCSDFWVIKSIE